MKKIIEGRKYDTDTAELIASYGNGLSRSDESWYEEDLYRKKTGEYFLYGEGGAYSRHGEGGFFGPRKASRGITALTDKEMQEWAVERLGVEEYESIFGEVSE